MIPASRKNRGFSLIELSIIIMIASMLAVAAMQEYRAWYNDKLAGDTEYRKNLITNAMTLFLTTYGRLPCPADPALAPDSPLVGYEACPPTFGGQTTALSATERNGDVIRVAGARDTTLDADANNDPVLLGSIPFAALGLSSVDAIDGWGNKVSYAVSEYLTNSSANRGGVFAPGTAPVFNDQMGVIRLNQMNPEMIADATSPTGQRFTGNFQFGGVPTNAGNADVSNLPNTFMLVIVSHGADGKGAYTYSGSVVTACTGAARDVQNCDRADAIYLKADRTTHVYNRSVGADFFDDPYTVYRIRRDSDKWAAIGASSMQNKTGGRVGIGTAAPSSTLDVNGNIRLDSFWATEYCSNNALVKDPGTGELYCFRPSMIAAGIDDSNPITSSAHCGTALAPALMLGVNGAQPFGADCVTTMNTTGITAGSCPAGQYMTGIDATGAITCALP